MLRRLHPDQPDSFAFTPANQAWAEAQISKYPPGRQASAVIALLWRAQEQEGWLSRPAIEHVADRLGMAHIRALEVATFYFMFQLRPVGSVAHVQVCGTTPCMLCGAEDLVAVCRDKIAANPHELGPDGKLSWEEVECLGACANAPMAQIGKDYYEDLSAARLGEILDELAAGRVPVPGPQSGRYASEPAAGLTALKEFESGRTRYNASVQRATELGDTVRRIDGSEVPLVTPWRDRGANHDPATPRPAEAAPEPVSQPAPAPKTAAKVEAEAAPQARAVPAPTGEPTPAGPGTRPPTLDAARAGGADDLKLIRGVGPKLETLLNELGFYHFDQIAAWTAGEVAWVDRNLKGFKGRVSRDDWVAQARVLAAGGSTEFADRAKRGDVY